MLTARSNVPRMADTCWLVLLHQKPAGSMEAKLTVGIRAVIKIRHHSCGHGRVTQGGCGVLQGLAHSQQKTQREQGELSSRGDHFTGSRQQALQPPALPAVPEWRSCSAVQRGKRRWRSKAGPCAGGRREDLCWHSLYRTAGQAEMGRRLPSPLHHLSTGHGRPLSRPNGGVPLRA